MPLPNDQSSFLTSTRLIKNVFAAQPRVAREIIGDGRIQRLLLVDGPGVVTGDLNEGTRCGTTGVRVPTQSRPVAPILDAISRRRSMAPASEVERPRDPVPADPIVIQMRQEDRKRLPIGVSAPV